MRNKTGIRKNALKSDYSAFEKVSAILTPGKIRNFLRQTPPSHEKLHRHHHQGLGEEVIKNGLRYLAGHRCANQGEPRPIASRNASAQTATLIPDTEAAQHIGQRATVEGTVVAVFTSNKGNTFINFGGKYPHQTFTGWIPKDSELAAGSTLSGLERKKIKITRTIELYKGKPEIKVMSKDQLALE